MPRLGMTWIRSGGRTAKVVSTATVGVVTVAVKGTSRREEYAWSCWPICGSLHRLRCAMCGQFTPHLGDGISRRPVEEYVEHPCG
jgi:hypothetical protein